jgi:hypothetical protein
MINQEDESGNDGADLTEPEILSLLEELRLESKQDEQFRNNGKLVEAFAQNRSTVGLVDPDLENLIYWDKEQTIALQELRNVTNTWSSLITKDFPSVVCVPAKQDEVSLAAAETGTQYIEYQQSELNTADKIKTIAKYTVDHGTGFAKVIFDDPTNRIMLTPHTIFDIYVDCVEDPDMATWAVERTFIDKYDAHALLKTVKPNAQMPKSAHYQDGAGITRNNKVEKWTIWYKPGSRFKKGLYACIIDNTVVESMDFPYVFKEKDGVTEKAMLPFVWFSCIPIRGASLGTTFAVECCPAQASLNKIFNRQVANALQSKQVLMLPKILQDSGVIESPPEENERYLYIHPQSADQMQYIKWLSPANSDPALKQMIDDLKDQIWDIAGINRSTGGGNAASGTSARAMAYQAELDLNKHSHAITSFRRFLKTTWELVLKLTQKYYTTAQQFSITGKNPVWFTGADLAGVDVKLEDRSEVESTAAVKKENAQTAVANGFADPSSLIKANPTIISESQKIFAKEIIQDVLDGKDVSPDIMEQLDPNILIEQIDLAIVEKRLLREFANVEVLKDFRVWLLKSLNSTTSADPASAGGEPPQAPEAPLPESVGQEPIPPAI